MSLPFQPKKDNRKTIHLIEAALPADFAKGFRSNIKQNSPIGTLGENKAYKKTRGFNLSFFSYYGVVPGDGAWAASIAVPLAPP